MNNGMQNYTQIADERDAALKENQRYRRGFKLLWEMATDYNTPWVNEVLRHNPLFACLFEEELPR